MFHIVYIHQSQCERCLDQDAINVSNVLVSNRFRPYVLKPVHEMWLSILATSAWRQLLFLLYPEYKQFALILFFILSLSLYSLVCFIQFNRDEYFCNLRWNFSRDCGRCDLLAFVNIIVSPLLFSYCIQFQYSQFEKCSDNNHEIFIQNCIEKKKTTKINLQIENVLLICCLHRFVCEMPWKYWACAHTHTHTFICEEHRTWNYTKTLTEKRR